MFSNILHKLVQTKSRFYSMDGCTYCQDQKKELGVTNTSPIIVNCGDKKNQQLCSKVDGFPTWEIHGKLYPGFHTKKSLSDIISKK
jgi:hypothetical protein